MAASGKASETANPNVGRVRSGSKTSARCSNSQGHTRNPIALDSATLFGDTNPGSRPQAWVSTNVPATLQYGTGLDFDTSEAIHRFAALSKSSLEPYLAQPTQCTRVPN
jgi:hypothetical protein